MRVKPFMIAVIIAAPLVLGACGLRGDLKTPPPLWGDDASKEQMDGAQIAKNSPTIKPETTK